MTFYLHILRPLCHSPSPCLCPVPPSSHCPSFCHFYVREIWILCVARFLKHTPGKRTSPKGEETERRREWESEGEKDRWKEKKRRKTCFYLGSRNPAESRRVKESPQTRKRETKIKTKKKTSTKSTVEFALLWYTSYTVLAENIYLKSLVYFVLHTSQAVQINMPLKLFL